MWHFRQSAFLLGRVLAPVASNPNSRFFKRWVSPTLKELHRRRIQAGPEPLKPRSTFLEWNYESELFAFGKRLGEDFNRNLLKQALTHRTYVNLQITKAEESGTSFEEIPSNREFIEEGENIINKLITDEFTKKHPEIIVKALRSYLTSEDMLANIASHIGLKDITLTGEFPVDKNTLANTLKAVVAALSQSQDLARAERFVKDFIFSQLNGKDISDIWEVSKPLEHLRELLGEETIEPRLCNQSAINTILANYQIGLYSNKKLLGIGWGESIAIAKETAALDAIQRIYDRK